MNKLLSYIFRKGKHKQKKPAHNDRKATSFLSRYGMTSGQWSHKKKELRALGKGLEIFKKQLKAHVV